MEGTPLEEIRELPVTLTRLEEAWQFEVEAWAKNGDRVSLRWDAVVCSSSLVWLRGDRVVVSLCREFVTKISLSQLNGRLHLLVHSGGAEWFGTLRVSIEEAVDIDDSILQG